MRETQFYIDSEGGWKLAIDVELLEMIINLDGLSASLTLNLSISRKTAAIMRNAVAHNDNRIHIRGEIDQTGMLELSV